MHSGLPILPPSKGASSVPADRTLDLESKDVGSITGYTTDSLCDFGKIISLYPLGIKLRNFTSICKALTTTDKNTPYMCLLIIIIISDR